MVIRRDLNHSVYYTKRMGVEITQWCEETFGERWSAIERNGSWACFWRGHKEGYEFIFETEEQLLLFMLRWL
jgi:hypothetical protein